MKDNTHNRGYVTIWRERVCGEIVWKWGRKGPFLCTASQESFQDRAEAEAVGRRMAVIYGCEYRPYLPKNDQIAGEFAEFSQNNVENRMEWRFSYVSAQAAAD